MHLPVVTLVLCLSSPLISLAEEKKLTIAPRPDQAVKVKDDATFTCSLEKMTIEWTYKSGAAVSTNNQSRIYYQEGALHIKTVTFNDTGSYICKTNDSAYNATAELKVYTMPSYFTEGMIIVGINCGLILLFIGCGINSLIQARKDKKRRKQEVYKSAPV